MSNAPTLLVVTPTLGRSPWLADAMGDVAALAQTVSLLHVLVSPAAMCDELRARWPQVRVVEEKPGGGLYGAINCGAASVSDWKWLTYLNDDDRLRAGVAAALMHDSDVVYGDVEYLAEDGRAIARMPVCRHETDVAALLAAGLAPFTQQGALTSAALWQRLGGFDTTLQLAGDFDFWVRAAAARARFHFVSEIVGGFRLRRGQMSGDVATTQLEIAETLRKNVIAKRAGAVARFRFENFARIVRRTLRTGRWRSRGMFSK